MNGPLAQIIAIVCYGNAFLKNRQPVEFWNSNSTFKFCDRVNFVAFAKDQREEEVAKSPSEWFEYLAKRGCGGLLLPYAPRNDPQISDRMSSGFVGGGGTWAIEALLPKNTSEYWVARWEVGNQNAPDQKIWKVSYSAVAVGDTPVIKDLPSLHAELASLTRVLEEIRVFAEKNNLAGWAEWFANALETSRSEKKHIYHPDLWPPGLLSPEAEVILDICQSAWVFGGMGSWNDMGFSDAAIQPEYDRVSDNLFRGINNAIVIAVNSGYWAEKIKA